MITDRPAETDQAKKRGAESVAIQDRERQHFSIKYKYLMRYMGRFKAKKGLTYARINQITEVMNHFFKWNSCVAVPIGRYDYL